MCRLHASGSHGIDILSRGRSVCEEPREVPGMGAGTLERIEEAASNGVTPEAIESIRALSDRLFEEAPWAAKLPPRDYVQMLLEILQASGVARQTGDNTELSQVVADWEATAEAYGDAQFQAAIADPDRRYVPWTE